eukprot:gb/GEZN01003505.1/.p1 GENE.gb/GEZN01003505.1/~~gb/GEZN01003505.1/.p1  ORF type:complete len:592 (+),score=91.73 gb/GEZN01003505.1/:260-2035(+)
MASFDYVTLDNGLGQDASSSLLSPLRVAIGFAGMAFTGLVGLATSNYMEFSDKLPFSRRTIRPPKFAIFTPPEGPESVTVKTGPSLLWFNPPGPRCIFSYGQFLSHDENQNMINMGAAKQDAYLYGATLYEPGPLASITGKSEDVLQGRVICWPAKVFREKLKKVDRSRKFVPDSVTPQPCGRAVVTVVKRDGTVKEAYFYYEIGSAAARSLIRRPKGNLTSTTLPPDTTTTQTEPQFDKIAKPVRSKPDAQTEEAKMAKAKKRSTEEDLSEEYLGGVDSFQGLVTPTNFRSGFVALVGRPNVGKSTLLNHLVGQKVAITSPVAQTTRNRLRAILTTDTAQLILLDTPGIHKPQHLLGSRLVKTACSSIGEVDLVLFLVDGSDFAGKGDRFVADVLRKCTVPVLLAMNKADLIKPAQKEALLDSYKKLLQGDGEQPPLDWPMYSVSAYTGQGTKELVAAMEAILPEGPLLYPPDAVSDQPERLLFGELIREQVLALTREEIPHSVAVIVDRVVDDGPRTAILATVLVERSSQKGILIGKSGAMLKEIGTNARQQMQKVIDGPVYLELFVKVEPRWRSNPIQLAELGYMGEE